MSCGALMPKSGLSWWMGSLSPSNYRWIFRCIHYLHWPGLCVCGCGCGWVSPGVTVTPAELQGVSWCVSEGGSRGSCFSSAVGSLQYSWALWGSVCCAALRLPLPLKLPSLLHQTLSQLLVCTWLSEHWQLWLLYVYHILGLVCMRRTLSPSSIILSPYMNFLTRFLVNLLFLDWNCEYWNPPLNWHSISEGAYLV